jgi:uncharacterized membrane protein
MTSFTEQAPQSPIQTAQQAVIEAEQAVWEQMAIIKWTWAPWKAWRTGRWGLAGFLIGFWFIFPALEIELRFLPTIPFLAVIAIIWAQRYSGRNAVGRDKARELALESLDIFRTQRQRARHLLTQQEISPAEASVIEDRWLASIEKKSTAQAQNAAYNLRRLIRTFTQMIDQAEQTEEQQRRTESVEIAKRSAHDPHLSDAQIDPVTAARAAGR